MPKNSMPSYDLSDWLDLLESDDPTEAPEIVRQAIISCKSGLQKAKYNAIGFMAQCLRKARKDSDYLRRLKSSSIFSGDENGSRKTEVIIARYILDVEEVSGPRYENARLSGKVAGLFAETEWSASKVASYVEKHGIRNTFEHLRQTEREEAGGEEEATLEQSNDDNQDRRRFVPDPFPSDRRESEKTSPTPPTARKVAIERALSQEPSAKPNRPKINMQKMLMLEVHEDLMAQIFELRVGDGANLTVYRGRNNEGQDWYNFNVVEIDPLKNSN